MTDCVLDNVAGGLQSSMTASVDLNSKNQLGDYKKMIMQIENKKTRSAIESMFNFLNSDIEVLQDENASLKEFMKNMREEIQQQRNDFEEVSMSLSEQTAQYRLVSANLEKM